MAVVLPVLETFQQVFQLSSGLVLLKVSEPLSARVMPLSATFG